MAADGMRVLARSSVSCFRGAAPLLIEWTNERSYSDNFGYFNIPTITGGTKYNTGV